MIRFNVFTYWSLVLTTTLHLPHGRWQKIVIPLYGDSLISWRGVIPGEACSLLPSETSLDDKSRGLPLIKNHHTEGLVCSFIIHIVRHPPLMTEDSCTNLIYTSVSIAIGSYIKVKNQQMLKNLLVQEKWLCHQNSCLVFEREAKSS